jgi:uracil-DNA glycosylase family 4
MECIPAFEESMKPVGAVTFASTTQLQAIMPECRRCLRLVEWREKVAREKVARFRSCNYWGKPVPSLGDQNARLLVVGLAPAAHGGNRTGRVFTGDRSGDWLYRSLHKFGFANQPNSVDGNDGLELIDCYITAVLHCAPPANKPTPEEILNCRPYLLREWDLLQRIRVVVALGRLAFDHVWSIGTEGHRPKRPLFGHGLEVPLGRNKTLIASFHPSQQNTFTGKLTEAKLDAVFRRSRELIEGQAAS